MKPRNSRISALWVFVTGILRKMFSFLLLVPIYFIGFVYRLLPLPLVGSRQLARLMLSKQLRNTVL